MKNTRNILSTSDIKRYKKFLDTELEAASMYQILADSDSSTHRSKKFQRLAMSEMQHAQKWASLLNQDIDKIRLKKYSFKLLLFKALVRALGTVRILPWLAKIEANEIVEYRGDPEGEKLLDDEREHSRILNDMVSPGKDRNDRTLYDFSASGKLRAAVLGINDGLVSNFSLVMGVAGGTASAGSPELILLAGLAGLTAGAFSMGAGEYISMRSQRDIWERLIEIKTLEIKQWPDEEEHKIEAIYTKKGFSVTESKTISKKIMLNPQATLDTLLKESVGINPEELGSPWGAAGSSFCAFSIGAMVPILPIMAFGHEPMAILSSALISSIALALAGGSISIASNKSPTWGSLRMLIAGTMAAVVTYILGYGVGLLI